MTRLSRRAALAGLLAAVALPRARAHAGVVGSRELLLIDGSLAGMDLQAAALLGATRRTLTLQDDLVRQWRGDLKREVSSQRGRVTALVRWDKALLLSGLAREAGIRSAMTRLNRSVFKVEMSV